MSNRPADREQPAQDAPERERSLSANIKLGTGVILAALLVLFFAQNFEEAQISLLWFDWDLPLVVALVLSAAAGSLATWLFTTFRGRARRSRERAMFDSAMREAKR